jgi:hypothetical protein
MAGRAEELYGQLHDAAGVLALIGEAEDAHLDCKEWPAKDDDAQKVLAKAACGLANADGGVLVIGMRAESQTKDDPDVVTGAAPVSDTSLVKSRLLGLISNLVEPGIVGIEAREVNEQANSKAGFVVVYVPKSEGSPRRSRKDWKFYLRIGSATLPMEYWQIEDTFGKRPHPKLTLLLEGRDRVSKPVDVRRAVREFVIGLKNEGAGIAKYPGLRFRRELGFAVDMYGIDGNHGFGIPLRPSEREWFSISRRDGRRNLSGRNGSHYEHPSGSARPRYRGNPCNHACVCQWPRDQETMALRRNTLLMRNIL